MADQRTFSYAGISPTATQTRIIFPVWRDSMRVIINWAIVPRKDAYQWYREARRYNREGARDDGYGGRLGSAALRVYESLIFDFLNFTTGRLDPAYEEIARRAGLARSTVAVALARLRSAGLIRWQRRCTTNDDGGRFSLAQLSNAYSLCQPSTWLGHRSDRRAPPPPAPATCGAHPPLAETIDAAVAERQAGGSLETAIGDLELGEAGSLARALAALGRAVLAAEGASPNAYPESTKQIETRLQV